MPINNSSILDTTGIDLNKYTTTGIDYGLTSDWSVPSQIVYSPNTITGTFEDSILSNNRKLEKTMDLLLKFMISKGIIKDEQEFTDFCQSAEMLDKLGEEE